MRDKKKRSYDYRDSYIKHNNGFLRKYYVCSQCYSILNRKSMEVDHIIPISKRLSSNKVINCVAICSTCNKRKLNRLNKKILLKSIIAKLLEEIFLILRKLFKLIGIPFYGDNLILKILYIAFLWFLLKGVK